MYKPLIFHLLSTPPDNNLFPLFSPTKLIGHNLFHRWFLILNNLHSAYDFVIPGETFIHSLTLWFSCHYIMLLGLKQHSGEEQQTPEFKIRFEKKYRKWTQFYTTCILQVLLLSKLSFSVDFSYQLWLCILFCDYCIWAFLIISFSSLIKQENEKNYPSKNGKMTL